MHRWIVDRVKRKYKSALSNNNTEFELNSRETDELVVDFAKKFDLTVTDAIRYIKGFAYDGRGAIGYNTNFGLNNIYGSTKITVPENQIIREQVEAAEKETDTNPTDAKRIAANAIMPRNAKSISEAQDLIRPLIGKPITNGKLGMTGTISGKSIDKLGSQEATQQSVSPALHAKAVANIDVLFKNAEFEVAHPDTKGRKEVEKVHRLGSLMLDETTGKYVPVMLTVVEYRKDGNRIYTVEAVDIEAKEKSAGPLTASNTNAVRQVPIADFANHESKEDAINDFNAKIQQLIETAKSSSETAESQEGDNGSSLRFHAVPAESRPNKELHRKALDKKIENIGFKIRNAWEDEHIAVKYFLDVLREAGVDIKDHNDFYMQATHLAGKNDAQLTVYNEQYQKPLNSAVKALRDAGFTSREIENYAILKHGLERNTFMSAKDIAEDKRPRKDYSGVLVVEEEVGQSAQEYIDAFEEKAGKERIDELWKKVNLATTFSLRKQMEGGLIDKDTMDELKGRWKYYIPLRGHDSEKAEDRWNYSPNMGTYFEGLKTAYGRRSRSETPFAFISQMAQSAIVASNKNGLNQTMLRLAKQDKTGLITANKTWYINGVPQEAEYSEDTEQYRRNIEDFEKDMADKEAKGIAKQKRSRLDIGGMFIKPVQKEQHAIRVSQNGKEYTVYIHGNPAVSRAINGLNKVPQKDLNAVGKITKEMAAFLTTRNPEFVVRNFLRDYIFASSIIGVKEDWGYWKQFQKNIPTSAGALQRHLRGKGDISKEEDRYLAEFIMNGGKTGFSHIVELEKVQKQVEYDIKHGNHKNMLRHLSDAVGNMNDFAENITRFSVYLASRKAGRSIVRSVSDAKEVTVNFNRSGAGGYGAQWIRPLYLFVNAAIQAFSNFVRTSRAHPSKATVLVMHYAASGAFLAPLLAALFGGWDEYWKLSDWERQNNFCVYVPGKGFVKIPLPQELRVFHALGDNAAQATLGMKRVDDALFDALSNFADLIPTDPAGSVTESWKDIRTKDLGTGISTFVSLMAPDFIKPVMQIVANRNFMGGKIYKENQKSYKPGYMKIRTNRDGEAYAPSWLVDFARFTDDLTGGNGVEKGKVSLHPDLVEHFVKGYTGGLYTLLSSSVDVAYKASKGENIEIRDTPIKRFFASVSDIEKMNPGFHSNYNAISREVETVMSKTRDYMKASATNKDIDINEQLKRLDYRKYAEMNEYIKVINQLQSVLPELDEDRREGVENRINELKSRVIELDKQAGAGRE
jgi:hypothetical protein